MTSSKPTKVGSFHSQEKEKMAQNNRITLTVAPRKPLNLNCSEIILRYKELSQTTRQKSPAKRRGAIWQFPKSLMCGSLNGQPSEAYGGN